MSDRWDNMYEALQAFRDEYGHCNVPTRAGRHQRLGRWVAAQRYKRKIGELDAAHIEALDAVGFVWSASERAWQKMYRALQAFVEEHGHANVPERFSASRKLANWVHSQRHSYRKGRLSSERMQKLEELGFCWSLRDRDKTVPAAARDEVPPTNPPDEETTEEGEKLYVIRTGVCVQYDGNGDMPESLETFRRAHDGDLPAYIPLPDGETIFFLGNPFYGEKPVPWEGRGPLPDCVMAFVREHGVLPRHEPVGSRAHAHDAKSA